MPLMGLLVSLGGVVSALNGWWTADEIGYALGHSAPSLLIADRKRLERVRGLGLEIPVVEIESDFASLLEHAPGAALPDVPLDEGLGVRVYLGVNRAGFRHIVKEISSRL